MSKVGATDKGRKIIAVVVALFEVGPDNEVHAAVKDFLLDEHEAVNLVGCKEVMSLDLAKVGFQNIRWINRDTVHRLSGRHIRQVYKSLEEIPENESTTTVDVRVIRFADKKED